MDQVKSILASKTFWTSVIGFLTTMPFAAEYVSGRDITGISNELAALAPILFALAGYFRSSATKQVVMATPSTAKSMNEAKATGLMSGSGSRYTGLVALLAILPVLGACVTPAGNSPATPPSVGGAAGTVTGTVIAQYGPEYLPQISAITQAVCGFAPVTLQVTGLNQYQSINDFAQGLCDAALAQRAKSTSLRKAGGLATVKVPGAVVTGRFVR